MLGIVSQQGLTHDTIKRDEASFRTFPLYVILSRFVWTHPEA